jgi:hypothetical protein
VVVAVLAEVKEEIEVAIVETAEVVAGVVVARETVEVTVVMQGVCRITDKEIAAEEEEADGVAVAVTEVAEEEKRLTRLLFLHLLVLSQLLVRMLYQKRKSPTPLTCLAMSRK